MNAAREPATWMQLVATAAVLALGVVVQLPTQLPTTPEHGPHLILIRTAEAAPSRTTGASAGNTAIPGEAPPSATGGLVDSTVGQLLADDLGCTATVVASVSGRVAVTAAHCVYVPQQHAHLGSFYASLAPGWRRGSVFVPGATGDQTPHGIWPVETALVDQRWIDTGDVAFDVAFLELGDLDGRTAQQTLGAQGIAFTTTDASPPEDATGGRSAESLSGEMSVFGYPIAPPFDGRSRQSCTSPVSLLTDIPHATVVGIGCPMTGGSSGGPWLVGLDEHGMGTVAAVTSFTEINQPGRLAGVALGPFAQQLWHAASESRTGEK